MQIEHDTLCLETELNTRLNEQLLETVTLCLKTIACLIFFLLDRTLECNFETCSLVAFSYRCNVYIIRNCYTNNYNNN